MAVTPKNKRVVWALSAARCAICRKSLVEREEEVGAYSFLGDVAHIHARRDGGPRADASLSSGDRDHPDNLLLLCLDHHKIVDDHSGDYPIEKLFDIKNLHLLWVRTQLENGTPWTSDIYNFFYINLPRVLMLAEVMGCRIDDPTLHCVTDLNTLGGGYIPFIQLVKSVIEKIHPKVVTLDSLSLTDNDVGLIVKFDKKFRTKSIGKALINGFSGFTGNLNKDPHIYTGCDGYKLVMPIEPRWLMTTTAGVHLSSGQGVFSGLCTINSINEEKRTILCSPLVFGHPKRW
ncbi:HNH endonuclease [Nitrosomonas ureae]|uniref:HNH endonuclease signature motif containing protein n=1 Tax=Nitrosomonas ureae TaxID=44577 RepID=UPI000D762534|nr:HNH endonuclease signature motif containing protein [Nitrosomonas ureae]PXX18383.1 HNH endonuclease [Nitrosomonas ureae]